MKKTFVTFLIMFGAGFGPYTYADVYVYDPAHPIDIAHPVEIAHAVTFAK